MLTINDGRSELWQWDTGRTLAVDADCSQVHFSNKVFGRSLDVDVVDGVAIIPDILLQTDKDLNVWAFVGTAENGYTKISKKFKVNRRNKPSDYVFTPPDQTSLEEIKEKLDYLESIQDPDAIKNAVEDYLEHNPVESPVQSVNGMIGEVELTAEDVGAISDETDPTVPAWAKQPTKPTYTAAEVGALPDTYTPPSQTAQQVGADPAGTAASAVSQHNTDATAHNDLRLALQGLSDRINAALDSDDTTLDQMSEVVAYIKSNKNLIDAITTSKVSVADIVNDLVTNVADKPLSAAQGVALKQLIDDLQAIIPGEGGSGIAVTGATVGQTIKIAAVDDDGVPTAWEPVDLPSGGGHWETVLDTVWEQDVINPTAFDSETGIFTCAEGELDNLELNKEYIFYQQCVVKGAAYNTILNIDRAKVTKLSDTTFSIDVTPPTTFVPTNVKFSKGACLAVTDIDAKKIRLTLDGQFRATATLYDKPLFGITIPYFGMNTGYMPIRNAYQAYQQLTAEVESPYRIVGKILCGFNAPSQNASFHFKNNSFCCPLVPYDVPEGNERTYFLTSDGTKIAKLYSTATPWHLGSVYENSAIINDFLSVISGTKVKLERWVE